MATIRDEDLAYEAATRINTGAELLSVSEMGERFRAIGYALDRNLDCRSQARYLDSGLTYPACTTGVKEADTGMSAFHYQARRDASFRAMQALRSQVFAISRNAILEA